MGNSCGLKTNILRFNTSTWVRQGSLLGSILFKTKLKTNYFVNLRIQSEYRKIGLEITPYLDNFQAVKVL